MCHIASLISPSLRIAALVVALLCCAPGSARADILSCDDISGEWLDGVEGVERVPHEFGGNKLLLVERCRRHQGHAYEEQRYNLSVWEDGEKLVEQTVHSGIITDSGSRYEIDQDAGSFVLAVGCGSVYEQDGSKMCAHRWNWSDHYQRLLLEAEPSEKTRLARFEEHLEAGEFEKAAADLAEVAEVSDVGLRHTNATWYAHLNQRLLVEIHKKALAAYKGGKKAAAKELAVDALTRLTQMPSDSPEPPKELFAVSLYELGKRGRRYRDSPPRYKKTRTIYLPKTEESARIVNDLGFIVAATGEEVDLWLARSVLENVLKTFPRRELAHLNLADVWWQLAEKQSSAMRKFARKHYRQYVSIVAADRVPKRVRERLEKEDDE